jgi:hypothetical protein
MPSESVTLIHPPILREDRVGELVRGQLRLDDLQRRIVGSESTRYGGKLEIRKFQGPRSRKRLLLAVSRLFIFYRCDPARNRGLPIWIVQNALSNPYTSIYNTSVTVLF